MKKKSPLLVYLFAASVLLTGSAFAGNDAKEVTISGDATCAKCTLDETDHCQTAIQVMEKGEKVTYYLENNPVAKAFHKNICETTEKVTATGTVAMKDGKHMMTVSKIEKSG